MKDYEELYLVKGDDIIPLVKVNETLYYSISNHTGKVLLKDYKLKYVGKDKDNTYELVINA
jgi:hypothetical protein